MIRWLIKWISSIPCVLRHVFLSLAKCHNIPLVGNNGRSQWNEWASCRIGASRCKTSIFFDYWEKFVFQCWLMAPSSTNHSNNYNPHGLILEALRLLLLPYKLYATVRLTEGWYWWFFKPLNVVKLTPRTPLSTGPKSVHIDSFHCTIVCVNYSVFPLTKLLGKSHVLSMTWYP